ncbi:MAG: hypothetical protein AAF730_04145 [Bacteroidota bacterium]
MTASVARGPFNVGLAFQRTRSEPFAITDFVDFIPPELLALIDTMTPEQLATLLSFADDTQNGLMLTAGYQRALTYRMRLEASARLQLLNDEDITLFQARLAPSYNDLHVNVVFFNPDGNGFFRDRPYFVSWYVGSAVNHLGRVQTLLGGGVWWNNLNFYATGFYSVNGAEDPFTLEPIPERERDLNFIQEHGVSLSGSYDWRNFVFGIRKNIPFKNAGSDISFSINYRLFFD